MKNETKTIYKVTYYNQGKLNIKKTLISYADFYMKTKGVELADRIDNFFTNH